MYNVVMENEVKQKLNNSPIKQVIIGLVIEGLFDNPSSIDTFYEQWSLKDTFTKSEIIKSVKFEINEKPKILQDITPGYVFKNADETETIVIELNTIRYSDQSKYVSYEHFIEKFSCIIESIFSYYDKTFNIKEIGLRYINCFDIESQRLDNEFMIVPTIRLNTDDNLPFATYSNYLSMANVQSQSNANMFATVKTVYKVKSPLLLNITFDIDTHDTTSYTLSSKEELNEKVSDLKEFKNLIFFSNFKNAYEMKEFQ